MSKENRKTQELISHISQARDALNAALEHLQAQGAAQNEAKPAATRASKPETKVPRSATSSKLPDHILGLRDSGFMKQPKTGDEVHAKLQPSYHCDVNRVDVAMLRLHKRRLLRKTSKTVGNRKKVAYVW